jgi:hypothetical protein
VQVFLQAENVYFEQWNAERIVAAEKAPMPGELHLIPLFGSTPGPAIYLMEPFLNAQGRFKYKEGLIGTLKDIDAIETEFNDDGRIARIKRGISETLVDINNIGRAKDEKSVWDDSQVGRGF